MYPILETKKLTANIYWMEVKAERIAKSCMPGQFVIVRTDADSERIPLTICDYNREKGTITIVFQPVGASTHLMTSLKAGDAFHDVAGPLGCPSELTKETKEALAAKKILFVAGGVGTAPVYLQVKWLHEQGVAADVIVGAKTKELLILEEEMKAVAGNLYVTTDDGSYGRSGMVTKTIQDLVEQEGKHYDLCVAIWPDDHDEICLQDNRSAEYPDDRFLKPYHGRRNRHVRRLPCYCRRRSEICLRRRSGI